MKQSMSIANEGAARFKASRLWGVSYSPMEEMRLTLLCLLCKSQCGCFSSDIWRGNTSKNRPMVGWSGFEAPLIEQG